MVSDPRAAEKLLDGRLKLRHLTLVVTISEHGSIMRAAEALRVTQPVVTRSLREIEDILAVSLFERHSRGVTLNVYGTSFVEHARAVLAQIKHAGAEISLLSSADLGTVTVGAHIVGINVLLPRAVAALKASHPLLTVVVAMETPDNLQTNLLAGDIDLVIGQLVATQSARIAQERFYLEPIQLAARESHPAHALINPTLGDLASYAWAFPRVGTAYRLELEQTFLSEGVPIPTNLIEHTSAHTMRSFAAETDVIAVLPASVARPKDGLKILGPPLKSISRAVGASWSNERPLTPAAAELLGHLRTGAIEIARSFGPGFTQFDGPRPTAQEGP